MRMQKSNLRSRLSYVEQQGLIDALKLYISSQEVHRDGFGGDNYLSSEKAREIITLLGDDLNNSTTATITSGKRYSYDDS